MNARRQKIKAVLNRLKSLESQFRDQRILAPVVRGGQAKVRIGGVVCQLKISPETFEGWGIFEPTSDLKAKLIREAHLIERDHYLRLFPLVRLILLEPRDDHWLAVSAHQANERLGIQGIVSVRLTENCQAFEVIQARWDGSYFWYVAPEMSVDPRLALYLRHAWRELQLPEEVQCKGLTPEMRAAYSVLFVHHWKRAQQARRHRDEARLREALQRAGAELRDVLDRQDLFTVTYEVDGKRHVSVVEKNDLTVRSAGVCLNGEDGKFDLESLVGVIREGHTTGEIFEVGIPEDD